MIPVLDGRALLYSFESTPEVRIGVAFGGNQSQPATEVPGVRAWLVYFSPLIVHSQIKLQGGFF